MSLLGKEGGAWVDVLGSKVLLDVGVRVWRQQIRGEAESLSKAQQDQESETLAPKTEVKSWTQRFAARAEGLFSDSGGVFVTADVPSFPRSASLGAACVAPQTTVSVPRSGSVRRSRGGVVSLKQFRGPWCYLLPSTEPLVAAPLIMLMMRLTGYVLFTSTRLSNAPKSC